MANNKNNTPANGADTGANSNAAANEAEDAARGAASQAKADPTWKRGDVKRLIAVHGRLVHQHTGQAFDVDNSVKVEIDEYAALQLEAGKLTIDAD